MHFNQRENMPFRQYNLQFDILSIPAFKDTGLVEFQQYLQT